MTVSPPSLAEAFYKHVACLGVCPMHRCQGSEPARNHTWQCWVLPKVLQSQVLCGQRQRPQPVLFFWEPRRWNFWSSTTTSFVFLVSETWELEIVQEIILYQLGKDRQEIAWNLGPLLRYQLPWFSGWILGVAFWKNCITGIFDRTFLVICMRIHVWYMYTDLIYDIFILYNVQVSCGCIYIIYMHIHIPGMNWLVTSHDGFPPKRYSCRGLLLIQTNPA